MSIKISLTKSQIKKIQPEIDKTLDSAANGNHGMLLAQIMTHGEMKVGFIGTNKALAIQKIMNKETVGEMC